MKHSIDDVYAMIVETLQSHSVTFDSQSCDDTIWFDDTINKKTWCISFNECDEYEGN